MKLLTLVKSLPSPTDIFEHMIEFKVEIKQLFDLFKSLEIRILAPSIMICLHGLSFTNKGPTLAFWKRFWQFLKVVEFQDAQGRKRARSKLSLYYLYFLQSP